MEWDQYFMGIAKLAAQQSKCRSRKVGAVLVRDKSIVSTGYNGPPRGMRPCDERWIEDGLYAEYLPPTEFENYLSQGACPRQRLGFRSGEGLDLCVAAHAERNALLQAAKLGVASQGATLYAWCGQVCKDCAIEIVNAGVTELVILDGQPAYDDLAELILNECGVVVRKIASL